MINKFLNPYKFLSLFIFSFTLLSLSLLATPSVNAATITKQITANADDANQTGNTVTTSGSTVWLGNSSGASYTGFRFRDVAIPQGSTITSAELSVYSTQSQWIQLNFNISGELAPNSAVFSNSSGSKLSQRSLTSNTVVHSSNTQWNNNTWYTVSDVSSVVQEVVAQSGWQEGNAMSLILKGTGNNWARKFIRSREGNASQAATLVITYEGGSPPDTTPPEVAITAPADQSTVSSITLVTANASDDIGVTKVEFFIDTTLVSTDTTMPYEYPWNTEAYQNGSHTITAKAYDGALNTDENLITVTVDNVPPPDTQNPQATITSPTNGSVVSGTQVFNATATDNVGVTQVEFYIDSVLVTTDTTLPYEYSWNTTAETEGIHSLEITAYDAALNTASDLASVTVDNIPEPDTTPPAVNITNLSEGSTVSGSINIDATATDNVGVTKVEFYIDSILTQTDTTSPYNYLWNTTVETNAAHVVEVIAYDAALNTNTDEVNVNVDNTTPPPSTDEWTQHAHDAQRTGYAPEAVETPWKWKWVWNGSNASGGISKVTSDGSLPRNVQPITGGGRVYIAAGSDGVYALDRETGSQLWNTPLGGAVNSTVIYDDQTQSVYALASNGTLYKLNAATGAVTQSFVTGQTYPAYSTTASPHISLPAAPALQGNQIFMAMGNYIYAIDKTSMNQLWIYNANSPVHTAVAYSPSRNIVIAATKDLNVHAVNSSTGLNVWTASITSLTGRIEGDPDSNSNAAEVLNGWPVIAETNGLVMVKLRLDWGTLWSPWNPWTTSNSTAKSTLASSEQYQALIVLDLDNGTQPFVANVGHGGYGDGNYMPMGTQPVVKKFTDGTEVAYTIVRGTQSYDARWDSNFGELMLDSSVAGYTAGDIRYIYYQYPPGASMTSAYLLTDEQPYVTMAGDYLFGGHWEAPGLNLKITNRASNLGAWNNKIQTTNAPTVITSQQGGCSFSTSHYCSSELFNTRNYTPGFYIYYNQGAVYDPYWSEYSTTVVSDDLILVRSTDGAIVALEHGDPLAANTGGLLNKLASAIKESKLAKYMSGIIGTRTLLAKELPHLNVQEAAQYVGTEATVTGEVKEVFNNGASVYIGFAKPHQGAFLIKIPRTDWENFKQRPDFEYKVGQTVAVTGDLEWYQGDPMIKVHEPSMIEIL